MEKHKVVLSTLCSICSQKLGRTSYPNNFPAEEWSERALIKECFDCVFPENPTIYPPTFCNSCYLTMKRMYKAKQSNVVYRTSLSPSSSAEHTEAGCTTCTMVDGRKTGGRPKAKCNIKGCPRHLCDHINDIAGPRYSCSVPLTTDRVLASSSVAVTDLMCRLCGRIVVEPVELACKHLMCRMCCFQLLKSHLDSIPCPQCQLNTNLTHPVSSPHHHPLNSAKTCCEVWQRKLW